ncbi:MAG: host-nuclease inhibitor Gam family protein [Brevinema sp.]
MQGYVTENKDSLITEPKRSFELPLLTLGFRKSSEVSIPNAKMSSILEALKNQGRYECIDTKETVKKSALSTWSNEALSEIGVSRKEKDTFFIEVKSEEL